MEWGTKRSSSATLVATLFPCSFDALYRQDGEPKIISEPRALSHQVREKGFDSERNESPSSLKSGFFGRPS